MQDSSMPMPSRTLRYSGSERPACRMNHTGVCAGVSPRAARRNGLSTRPGCGVVLTSITGRIFAGEAAWRRIGTMAR